MVSHSDFCFTRFLPNLILDKLCIKPESGSLDPFLSPPLKKIWLQEPRNILPQVAKKLQLKDFVIIRQLEWLNLNSNGGDKAIDK